MPEYNITETHFRDIYGHLLWASPLETEYRLYEIGETFLWDEVEYKIERMAVVDHIQHVNVSVVEEDIIITEPHL